MNKPSDMMTRRIQIALKSGKLKLDGTYTVPQLAATIGATRPQLRQAVNREYGSISLFCAHLGFTGKV